MIQSLPSNYFKDLKMSLQPPIAGVLQKISFAFAQALFCTSLIPQSICIILGMVSKLRPFKTVNMQVVVVVYDRNHYIGLGPIPKPKPKLADTFGRYRNQYRIPKLNFKRRIQLPIVFYHHKDLFIKIHTISVVTLLLFLYKFL